MPPGLPHLFGIKIKIHFFAKPFLFSVSPIFFSHFCLSMEITKCRHVISFRVPPPLAEHLSTHPKFVPFEEGGKTGEIQHSEQTVLSVFGNGGMNLITDNFYSFNKKQRWAYMKRIFIKYNIPKKVVADVCVQFCLLKFSFDEDENQIYDVRVDHKGLYIRKETEEDRKKDETKNPFDLDSCCSFLMDTDAGGVAAKDPAMAEKFTGYVDIDAVLVI